MHTFLKAATFAMGLAGASLAVAGTADARDDRNQSGVTVPFGWGNDALGYRDGYWDHDRRWHSWQHSSDRRHYRDARGSDYHHWNHTRDRNDGWRGRDDRRDRYDERR